MTEPGRIAFLTAACLQPGHPALRVDHWEHDRELAPMQAACARRGLRLEARVWDDPALDPSEYEAMVIGTTWDYTDAPERFLETLEAMARRTRLFNPVPTVRWNHHKSYLRDLAARGARVVPTRWAPRADADAVARAFDALGTDEIVVKPVIGATSWRQTRLRRGEPLPPRDELPPAEALIQPYLPAVASEGEYSFVFFDRAFSHCARKFPERGDYRVQSAFGGREAVHEASAGEVDAARRVLDAVEGPLLHARVDMVRDGSGDLAVMELELIEPYLYPDQGPGMGDAFAAALERHLADPGAGR